MGLLQNGYRHNLTGRLAGATNLDGWNPSAGVYVKHRTAASRNQFAGPGITDSKAAVPNGHLAPSAWILPLKAGGMSSRFEARIEFSTVANGVMGYPIAGSAAFAITLPDADILPEDDASPLRTASASFAITVLDADGQLISSGAGSASMEIATNTPLLTASLNGVGATVFAITTNTPLLGAEAALVGDAAIEFTVSGGLLPTNDASPLRTGTTSFVISGALVPYAIGSMIGTTDVAAELTTEGIVDALWNAIAANYNDAGTMGNKLNTASSGGVDMNALAAAVVAALEATTIPVDVAKVNGLTVDGSGTEIDPWGPQ